MTQLNTESSFQLQVPESICHLIDRAAASACKSRTDFMLDALLNAAEGMTPGQAQFRVSEDQMKTFEEILDRPLSENAAYQRMMARKAPWER